MNNLSLKSHNSLIPRLEVFHSSNASHAIDKYIIYYMTEGAHCLFSDGMSQWLISFVPGLHTSTLLVHHCTSSALFNGAVSNTEMVSALTWLDAHYSSHSFFNLNWNNLVWEVKTHFQLCGGKHICVHHHLYLLLSLTHIHHLKPSCCFPLVNLLLCQATAHIVFTHSVGRVAKVQFHLVLQGFCWT